jgi:uncharacterized membrane protein AbrB (regulator of aidB expression)
MRRGFVDVDWVMTIATVAAMVITSLLLVRFTSLPHWACFLIGVPGGVVVFWSLLLTVLFTVRCFRSRD